MGGRLRRDSTTCETRATKRLTTQFFPYVTGPSRRRRDRNRTSFFNFIPSSMNTPSFAERELKKAGSLVKEDATAISSLAAEAARSGAYVYPMYVLGT